jgi:hypothetical protein
VLLLGVSGSEVLRPSTAAPMVGRPRRHSRIGCESTTGTGAAQPEPRRLTDFPGDPAVRHAQRDDSVSIRAEAD